MVTIKEATENATAFAKAALGAERTRSIRLEEVESTAADGEEAWLITLSMLAEADDPLPNPATIFARPKREYKTFKVLKQNGDVTSMRIRELADA
jgi:hypothetical protein